MAKKKFEKFLKNTIEKLQHEKSFSKRWDDYRTVEIFENQAFYILDWRNGKLVFAKGIKNLLGFNDDQITFLDVAQNLIHPEDKEKLGHVTKEVSTYCFQNNVMLGGVFRLSYRMQKADGSYIKVMRHTGIYELDEKGQMLSNFTFLDNVTNFENSSKIKFDVFLKGHDMSELKAKIKVALQTKVTAKELEVLNHIATGLNTKEIAQKMNIGVETIKSHRKNLLIKFFASNSIEMLKKANDEGIIDF